MRSRTIVAVVSRGSRYTIPGILFIVLPVCLQAAWFPDQRLTYDQSYSLTCSNNSWCVAGDGLGHAHVVWHDNRDGNYEIYYKQYDRTAWGADQRLTIASGSSQNASVAADDSCCLHVVWHDYRDGDYEIYYKKHDGTTWGPDQRLTDSPGSSMSPSLAVDDSGHVHVVWHDYRDGNYEVYYKRHDGATWGPDQRLTESPGNSKNPSVAVDDSCHVHVVWDDDRDGDAEIYYKRHDSSGWSEDERLTAASGISMFPSIATHGPHGCHVVWQEYRDGNSEIYHKWWDGQNWAADERLTSDSYYSGSPSVAVDDSGCVHVVWQDTRDGDSEAYYKVFDGLEWQQDLRLTVASGTSQSPGITVDPEGYLHVVWHDRRDANYEIYWKSSFPTQWAAPEIFSADPDSCATGEAVTITELAGDHFLTGATVRLETDGEQPIEATGTTLESPQKITCELSLGGAEPGCWDVVVENVDGQCDTLSAGFLVLPGPWQRHTRLTEDSAASITSGLNAWCIATDAAANPHVVWYDSRDGNEEIYYKGFDGIAWSEDTRLTNALEGSQAPSVAIDSDDNIHVVWQDWRDGNWEVYYKRFDGASWGTDQRLTNHEWASHRPSLTADNAGDLHLVWQDYRHPDEIYYRKSEGGTWGPVTPITYTNWQDWTPAIAADAHGNLHLIWSCIGGVWPSSDQEIYYQTFDGVSWQPHEILTCNDGHSHEPTIAIDIYGRLHVAWKDEVYDDYDYDIYYKTHDDSGWSDAVQLTDAPGDDASPSLACDNLGNVHLVWQDARHGQSEIYYRQYDGITWGSEHRLTASAGEACRPSVACDSLGRIHVVWYDTRDGNAEVYYKLADPLQCSGLEGMESARSETFPVRIAPNPMSGAGEIRYNLASRSRATVSVYDIRGHLVWKSEVASRDPGTHRITWDGKDRFGNSVASGIYFVRVEARAQRASAKIIVLR